MFFDLIFDSKIKQMQHIHHLIQLQALIIKRVGLNKDCYCYFGSYLYINIY